MTQATVNPSSTTRCGTPESLRRLSERYSETPWGSLSRMVHLNFGEFPFHALWCMAFYLLCFCIIDTIIA
jgi:hypothetical protein